MAVHDGHRKRLIGRFLEEGLDRFEPHQALELLLFFAIPRQDTNELAHRLIQTFGTLGGVFDAPYEELLQVKGVGENTAALLKMIPDLTRLYYAQEEQGAIINNYREAEQLLMPKFLGRKEELVYGLFLDNKGRCISVDLLHEGTVNISEISVRKLMAAALRHNASSVILAHNHPNGVALPSPDDVTTTRLARQALQATGIRLLDHLIFADRDYVSLADSNSL